MIVDGRAIAQEVLARAKARAQALPRQPKVVAYAFAATPVTRSYLKIKARSAEIAGCAFEVRGELPLAADADAVIVQLPLPEGMDESVLDAIPFEKDADVLSHPAREKFEHGDADALLPPVVGAIKEIFDRSKVSLKGKRAVVIGAGFLVGAPAATWLAQQGAQVTVVTLESDNLAGALRDADIIVSGAGAPHLIKPEMIKEGAILIDAGTSESDGTIVGDADPTCAPKCALFTPVPGGVGPIAVAKLFENAVTLSERSF